ncbi:MAG TPA: ADP-ribosylglycohydrolase family protein [Clostridiales bacterium]|nr:ADP-ribosylglycohydrolase family protein [Clostridiales bacterium]
MHLDGKIGFERLLPDYAALQSWEVYSANILTEFRQMHDEGREVAKFKTLAQEIAALPRCKEKEDMAESLAELMQKAPMRADYPYFEPSDLDEIRKHRPADRKTFSAPKNKESLRERIQGAWLGRIAGCLLGKPIEGIRFHELNYILQQTGNYPLKRYIRADELTEEIISACSFKLRGRCFVDTIQIAPFDDDTNYTVMAACKLIDVYGRDFTPADVARCWVDSQPKNAYCTAERVAFINFVNGYYPPYSAIYKNAFREWIGAQIRGDYFGYINPGNPELAAEMAWRDASISHVKNGIYGEMFVAAMLACAAVCDDIEAVIKGGLSEIPEKSRLYEAISEVFSWRDKGLTVEECIKIVHERYNESDSHDWCHTIPNAILVAISLLYGECDFEKTVCLAVSGAFDCDCNGATAGSVIGMLLGAKKIPSCWTESFNGQLQTTLFGLETVSVASLCDLTMQHIQ